MTKTKITYSSIKDTMENIIILSSISRVARWCEVESRVPFRLDPENTSRWQGGARACSSLCRVLEHPFNWV